MKTKQLRFFEPAALLLLRVVFGFRIFYGVIDNVVSWQHMLEFRDFLENFNFPFPLASAVISVYVQLLVSISWFLGFKVRFFSILLIINFIVALLAVHLKINDSYLNMYDAISLLTVAIFLAVIGGGRYSIDQQLKGKRGYR